MKNYRIYRSYLALLTLCLILPTVTQAEEIIQTQRLTQNKLLTQEQGLKYYQIPSGSLTAVLNNFALAAGVSVLFDPALTQNKTSEGLTGKYSTKEGFSNLLKDTDLSFKEENNGLNITIYNPYQISDSSNKDAIVLNELTVIAQSDPRSQIYERPDSASIIGRTEIDRTGPRHASEILQATPGVATVTNEQNPSVSVNIRGLKDFGRVNMNIDGMRQNFQRSGHQQRNGEMFFDTEFLASVEISKGPSSDVGGAGTTGGVATFRTIEANDIIDQDERSGGRLRANTGVIAGPMGKIFLAAWRLPPVLLTTPIFCLPTARKIPVNMSRGKMVKR